MKLVKNLWEMLISFTVHFNIVTIVFWLLFFIPYLLTQSEMGPEAILGLIYYVFLLPILLLDALFLFIKGIISKNDLMVFPKNEWLRLVSLIIFVICIVLLFVLPWMSAANII